jgi:predicted NBD/HSP70 family sugar kinase
MSAQLRGTNQESGRPYNRRIVLETIRLSAPIARGEIARKVGLTVQTVSTIIRELELQGFVRSTREQPKGRGHPSTSLAVNPEGGFAIGLHVTPISVEAALINLAGDVIARFHRSFTTNDVEATLAVCGVLAAECRALRPEGRMLGIGLAIPGPSDIESMSFVGSTTLEGWKGVDVQALLTTATGLPVFTGVDLASAALGDHLYGAGRNFRDFYYLYFGVGLGGTMVHDGSPIRGAFGNAGEIGHMPLVPGGDPCPCGNRGCLERYVSLDALGRRLQTAGHGEDISQAIRDGHPVVEAWIGEVAPVLRAAVTIIENLFDPETIIFGGLAPEALLSRLLAAAEPLAPSIAERRTRLAARVTLASDGEDAVLRGAAALAVSGMLSPRVGEFLTGDADADPIMTTPTTKAEFAA